MCDLIRLCRDWNSFFNRGNKNEQVWGGGIDLLVWEKASFKWGAFGGDCLYPYDSTD